MKRIFIATATLTALLFTTTLFAQNSTDSTTKKKKSMSLSISNKGISFEETNDTTKSHKTEKTDKEKTGKLRLTFAMMDLGFNMLNDATTYTDPTLAGYLRVPAADRNADLFDLKNGKSINFNIYPLMVKLPVIKTKNQRLYIATGLGLQVYNFRFDNSVSYVKSPAGLIMDTISFRKNKLAVNYLSVPLMVTSKTRLHKDTWLVYGAGVQAGYRLSSWNKQTSDERGKIKTHGNFDLKDFNTCVTAEFGIEGVLRFYGSYQLTSLYENNIDQRPISVGIRIGGI
ncbi:MAG: outer membrane beta-barrel protein [Flavipsychrobacter sp.]|nr:outer membrane beta-barrel protein [Flavipsychrobacter sp.]